MNLTLEADDLAALSMAQKAAIVDSLFLIIAADRKVEPAEVEAFNGEVHRIPWGMDPKVLDMILERARNRLKCVLDRIHWQIWIKEIALTIQSPVIREKTLATMSRIALRANQVDDTERGLLNTFAGGFELPMDRLMQIRKQIIEDNAAR